MQNLKVGGKLFNTIVILGMSLVGACGSNDSQMPQPVSSAGSAGSAGSSASDARNDGTAGDGAIPDSGSRADACPSWFCC